MDDNSAAKRTEVMQHNDKFLTVVKDAITRIQETSVTRVKEKLENHETFYLIDVREDSEWQAGSLPKAIHIGKGVIERDIQKLIPNTQAEIVLFCGGGYRSALAADSIQNMGYTNVFSMAGGVRGWVDAGLSLEPVG